jgi:pyridinium-3,5-biscarboxylic acid mononucleotide sulfurtransferase
MTATHIAAKHQHLRDILRRSSPLLVAYSGGVDSAFLLDEAHTVLAADVRGVLADSPSLPRAALQEALELARERGYTVEVVKTGELDLPDYRANPFNRCYFCKAELFRTMESVAARRGFPFLAYGENADDAREIRPGTRAAAEFRVLAPLREAGLTKAEIRSLSHRVGLRTAEAPAQPCLSSRIPHGTPVTVDRLRRIEEAEKVLWERGFRVFRIRYLPDPPSRPAAKIQVAAGETRKLETCLPEVSACLVALGFGEVIVDPKGYQGAGLR